jgi:hypothetical protein
MSRSTIRVAVDGATSRAAARPPQVHLACLGTTSIRNCGRVIPPAPAIDLAESATKAREDCRPGLELERTHNLTGAGRIPWDDQRHTLWDLHRFGCESDDQALSESINQEFLLVQTY